MDDRYPAIPRSRSGSGLGTSIFHPRFDAADTVSCTVSMETRAEAVRPVSVSKVILGTYLRYFVLAIKVQFTLAVRTPRTPLEHASLTPHGERDYLESCYSVAKRHARQYYTFPQSWPARSAGRDNERPALRAAIRRITYL